MTVTTFSFTTGATVSSWTVPNHTGLVTITAIGGKTLDEIAGVKP